MADFDNIHDYRVFAHIRRSRWRFSRAPEVDDFLAGVVATAKDRVRKVSAGTSVWRAQLGWEDEMVFEGRNLADEDIYVPKPFSKERMKPKPDQASEGRANTKGIPALYVATTEKTALSEMRPNLASILSVAELKTVKDLNVVDCTIDIYPRSYLEVMRAEKPIAFFEGEMNQLIWREIDDAFALPVDRQEFAADYAPTQNIAEVLKKEGYDGIQYRSAYDGNGGRNIALFDLASADVVSVRVSRPKRIDMEFE
ncbi:MAG: RES family NAD+ phosphorylase [Proteobacteria bacterium]|nr:RES family NAD+ phosphorylase [Pseudomonadota bacterium]